MDGEIVQHIEYVPFGEVFIEERNNKWNTPFLFNAKELDEETGLYYYGARYYDPRTSVWISTDPLQEKYPNISTYTYVANNPVKYIDPDGKRIYFVGGAANDSDGWNYIGRFKSIWTSLGLKDFRRVNASHGKIGDVNFSHMYRNSDSYTHRTGGQWSSTSWQTYARQDTQYKNALKGISENLKANPLQDVEQLNLVGYSYGAVLQAHLAIGLTELGHKVDNLVLIGSPTSDDSPLMKTLQGLVKDGKIGKIIRHGIEGDYLSNLKSQIDFLKGGIQNSPLGDGNDGAYFDLARPGSQADKKIESVGQKLKNNGVE